MTNTTPWRSARAERTDWRDQAACRRLDPDLFFPVSMSGASLPQIETARRVCERCPVLTACLRWAGFRYLGWHHRGGTARHAVRAGAPLNGPKRMVAGFTTARGRLGQR